MKSLIELQKSDRDLQRHPNQSITMIYSRKIMKTKTVKANNAEQEKFKQMIFDLFRVGDCWVDIDCFVRFENEFSQVTKKYGFDLHQIYYGKSFAEMKRTYKRYDELKNMKSNMTFKERAILGREALAKQPPVTLKEAKAQVKRIKANSSSKIRKRSI